MRSPHPHQLCILLWACLHISSIAQIPSTLVNNIPPPPNGAQAGAQLGYSVAVDGAYAVVGAPFDDLAGSDTGVVKVFDSSSGALLLVIPNPSPSIDDQFGNAVAILGSRLVVGALRDDTGAINSGSAYVYDLSSGTPTQPLLTLSNPSPAQSDFFGAAVAISGSRMVVGSLNGQPVYVYDLDSSTPNLPVATLVNPAPNSRDAFGGSLDISGTKLVVGARGSNVGAFNTGRAYVYDLNNGTPSAPVFTLNNPTPAESDLFGSSVTLDGVRVVVGARSDDTLGENAGIVYVYDLTSGTPTVPVVTLSHPTSEVAAAFGSSVEISGNRVVVGAAGDDTGASSAGSAFVYDLSSGTPSVPSDELNNPEPAANDFFGYSVGISGTRVVIGAKFDDTGATEAGSAYLYVLSGSTPTSPIASLNNPGPVVSNNFGYSVAVSGQLLVVGSPYEDTEVGEAGCVRVYDLSGVTPSVPVYTLPNPTPEKGDNFGFSVAVSGNRVVVGAPSDDSRWLNQGSAYVYDLSSSSPTVPLATLNSTSSSGFYEFGLSVAISGTRVVVGAHRDDTGATSAGRAYVYDMSSGTPSVPVVTILSPTPASLDSFGWSVAISGTRVVVGAIGDDYSGSKAGSAYVYDLLSATPSAPVITLNNPVLAANDQFGWSVAISGARLVVGAIGRDTGANNAGSATVYDLSSETPTVPVATLIPPAPAVNDQFGHSVAVFGERVVVGAIGTNMGADDAGGVYVYDLSLSTPTVPTTLQNPTPEVGDRFGFCVAIDGTIAAVGAPYDDTVNTNQGYAYIYGNVSDQDNDGLLDSWELAYWPTNTGHGPLDDHDKDGYVELLELAFGLNPTVPNVGGLPEVTEEGGYLTMTITKQPGVTYEVESAATLPSAFSAGSTTILLDNATTLKVRDNVLISTPPARFMRVRVTAAP